MEVSRGADGIIVTLSTTGNDATDDSLFSDAVTLLNAEGRGTLRVRGSITINSAHDFTGPISIIGDGADATINFKAGSPVKITWGAGWEPTDETHFDITTAALDSRVTITGGTPPAVGDHIIIWSEDQIEGVEPHYGPGHGQHPMEMHQVSYLESSVAYVDGFVVDEMTAAARARGVVATLKDGIKIDNIRLHWADAVDPADFAVAMKFNRCTNVTITNSVKCTNFSPGAFWFRFCSDVSCEASIMGLASRSTGDGVYGIVVDVVNGVQINSIIHGMRHSFTTTSGMIFDSSDSVSSIDTGTDTITAAGHGLVDGNAVNVTASVMPGGLTVDTPYWVVSGTTDTLKLAATPGGAAIDITTTGTAVVVHRESRFGTPLNVTFDGLVYVNAAVTAGPSYSGLISFDTHAEGWGIVCRADFIMAGLPGSVNYAGQFRSRNGVFKDCFVRGDNIRTQVGFRLMAEGCQVENCTLEGLWRGVIIQTLNGVNSPDSCSVTSSTFRRIHGNCILLTSGDDHRVSNNYFTDSSSNVGAVPLQTPSLIRADSGTGHLIFGNQMPKEANTFVLDPYTLDEDDITFTGNICTGYGAGTVGFGRGKVVTADHTTDQLTSTVSYHGFAEDEVIRFSSDDTLPLGLYPHVDYYVIKTSDTVFQVELSLGGGAIDFTDNGTGTHTSWTGTTHSLESTYQPVNQTDPRGTSTAADGATAPSVAGLAVLVTANTSPTTLNNLVDGTYGQKVIVMVDTNTTVQDGSAMQLDGGANFAPSTAGGSLTLYFNGTSWDEIARATY
jgi:hypothetical protein